MSAEDAVDQACPTCHNHVGLAALEAKRVQAKQVGISSSALVRFAYGFGPRPGFDSFPFDRGDLGRCEFAYEHAPVEIQERMLPLLREFRAFVEARYYPSHRSPS